MRSFCHPIGIFHLILNYIFLNYTKQFIPSTLYHSPTPVLPLSLGCTSEGTSGTQTWHLPTSRSWTHLPILQFADISGSISQYCGATSNLPTLKYSRKSNIKLAISGSHPLVSKTSGNLQFYNSN